MVSAHLLLAAASLPLLTAAPLAGRLGAVDPGSGGSGLSARAYGRALADVVRRHDQPEDTQCDPPPPPPPDCDDETPTETPAAIPSAQPTPQQASGPGQGQHPQGPPRPTPTPQQAFGPGQGANPQGPPKSAAPGEQQQGQQGQQQTSGQQAGNNQQNQQTGQQNKNGNGSKPSGLLELNDPTCGPSDANADQPNGSQEWMNCGLDKGGWTPPHVTPDQLVTIDLSAEGIFKPCEPYFDKFKQYGAELNVPPLILASFALQESGCNPHLGGNGGEAGMMQLGQENCAAAQQQGIDCKDIDYNIKTGASYFAQQLKDNDNNVFLALGTYNGWYKGLTTEKATAVQNTPNCFNQNNLDYLYQMVNGWLQGKDGHKLGKIRNLDKCPGTQN